MKAETVQAMEAVGIRLGVRIRWHRLPDIADDPVYLAAFVCQCTNRVRQWPMVLLDHGGRRLLIGQCRDCGLVGWCVWSGKVYTGARILDGKALPGAPELRTAGLPRLA